MRVRVLCRAAAMRDALVTTFGQRSDWWSASDAPAITRTSEGARRSASHISSCSAHRMRSEAGTTRSAGHGRSAPRHAIACRVLPSPISSASKARARHRSTARTPTRWKPIRLEANRSGMHAICADTSPSASSSSNPDAASPTLSAHPLAGAPGADVPGARRRNHASVLEGTGATARHAASAPSALPPTPSAAAPPPPPQVTLLLPSPPLLPPMRPPALLPAIRVRLAPVRLPRLLLSSRRAWG